MAKRPWTEAFLDPNPIMVKELLAYTREPRFFVIHMALVVVACLIALGMTQEAHLQFGTGIKGYDAASVGMRMYNWLQMALIIGVIIMVPGFCAASISSEKDRGTFDLLIGCAVDPITIIRGKFFAALAVVGVLVISVFPLLALSNFFGGVSALHVLMFGVTLVLFTALLASCVIYVSAIFENSTWATLSSYLTAFFVGLCFAAFFQVISGVSSIRGLYGIEVSGQQDPGTGGIGIIMLGWILPVTFALWLTAFFFTAAAAVLDRLPAYRLGKTHQAFKWVREVGLGVLAAVSILSFILACVGV